jgi:hypothetical protein
MRTLAIVTVAALSACATPQKHTDNLVDIAYKYNDGVRWGRYDDAALFVPIGMREAFLDRRDELAKDLKIDDYELLRVRLADHQKKADVQVKWTWHLDSKGVVHETVTDQLWKRKGETWTITAEVRQRGEKMPGVAEPKAKAEASDTDGADADRPDDSDAQDGDADDRPVLPADAPVETPPKAEESPR